MQNLNEVYEHGIRYGYITEGFEEWRENVVARIRGLFGVKGALTDEEIVTYFDNDRIEQELDREEPCLRRIK